jgi:hypothetical protein
MLSANVSAEEEVAMTELRRRKSLASTERPSLMSHSRIVLPPLAAEERNAILAGLLALQFLITTDALPSPIRRIHTNSDRALGIADIDRLFQTLDCACSRAPHPTEEDRTAALHESTRGPMNTHGSPANIETDL